MPDRPRIPVIFGEGLNRATGKTVVRPGAMRDLRNVYLFEGKAQVRKGLELAATLFDENSDPMTDILAIHPFKAQNQAIIVGYNAVTGRIYAYTADADLSNPALIEHTNGNPYWFQVAVSALPPIVFVADSFSKVFFAHSERAVSDRAPTVYYDWVAGKLQDLLADLDDTGDANIYFRGVATYHDYLLGWGFGNKTDPERAELVRGSMPGDPLSWNSEHYWLAGQRSEAVLNVKQVGQLAVVFKETELHRIVGYSRDNFGIFPLDPLFGLVGARLVMHHDGALLFWSQDGPRVTDGNSASTPIGIPLDLAGFEPADLARVCDMSRGFAALRPHRRIVEFIFEKHGYALSFLQPDTPKWTYQRYGVPLNCFGLISPTEAAPGSLTGGYPKCVASTEPGWTIYDYSAVAVVEHFGTPPANGGVLELFVRANGGAWALTPFITGMSPPYLKAQAIDVGPPTQKVSITGLTPNTAYDLAWRYRVGGSYAADWADPDPDNWTGAAVNSVCINAFTTTQGLRVLDSVVWSRTSAVAEQMLLTFSSPPGAPSDSTDIEKDAGAGWTPVTTVPAGTWTYAYVPTAGEPETMLWFRVKPSLSGIWSNVISAWVGPIIPNGYASNSLSSATGPRLPPYLFNAPLPSSDPLNPGPDPYLSELYIAWVSADPAYLTEVWVDTESTPAGYYLATTAPTGDDVYWQDCPRDEGTIWVTIRHKLTTFGVDDFSDWSESRSIPPWSPT